MKKIFNTIITLGIGILCGIYLYLAYLLDNVFVAEKIFADSCRKHGLGYDIVVENDHEKFEDSTN